jgi:hypothetical protein
MKNEENTQHEIEVLEKEYDTAWKKAIEIREKLHELKRQQALPVELEGKFIKYEENCFVHYILVEWVYDDPLRYKNFEYGCTIRGFGFGGEFTGYHDATDWKLDYMYEIDIFSSHEEEFRLKLDSIQIIDENEFRLGLDTMLKDVKSFAEKRLNKK